MHRRLRRLAGEAVGQEAAVPEGPHPVVQLPRLALRARMHEPPVAKAEGLLCQPAGEQHPRPRRGLRQYVEVDLGHGVTEKCVFCSLAALKIGSQCSLTDESTPLARRFLPCQGTKSTIFRRSQVLMRFVSSLL